MSGKKFRIFIVTKLTEMEEKRDNEHQKEKANEFQEVRKFLQELKEEIYTIKKNQVELLEMKAITGSQNLL